MMRVLVIDDDASRHGDIEAWASRAGLEVDLRARPPGPGEDVDAACVVIHAGYGRSMEGFPRERRPAEAAFWFLGEASYLFHEDLEALRALGERLGPRVPLVVMTGGSTRDVPLGDLAAAGRGRTVVAWNAFGLLATTSAVEMLEGPGEEPADAGRVASEIRHDLLNRLWNLALAGGGEAPDAEEIAAIVRGEEDQSPLDVLVERTPALDGGTGEALAGACREAAGGRPPAGLGELARRAIREIESA
jgi:hypothetical protein